MWYEHSVKSYKHIAALVGTAWYLPATRRMVPKIPQIGLVTAEGGTSVFAEDIRNSSEIDHSVQYTCSSLLGSR